MASTAEIEVRQANIKLQCPQCDEWIRITMRDISFCEIEGECWITIDCPFCKTEVTVTG
jgi:phage FluMu protein Com